MLYSTFKYEIYIKGTIINEWMNKTYIFSLKNPIKLKRKMHTILMMLVISYMYYKSMRKILYKKRIY